MDPITFAGILFVLVTLPLLLVASRLKSMLRALARIENMNLRSIQRFQ